MVEVRHEGNLRWLGQHAMLRADAVALLSPWRRDSIEYVSRGRMSESGGEAFGTGVVRSK